MAIQTHCNPCCNTLQLTATHCNTLQHTAAHCSTLQYTAPHCITLRHIATHCNTLQHTATHYGIRRHTPLHSTATHCNTLHNTATLRTTLQHISRHCNFLQHPTDHYNTLQRILNPIRKKCWEKKKLPRASVWPLARDTRATKPLLWTKKNRSSDYFTNKIEGLVMIYSYMCIHI